MSRKKGEPRPAVNGTIVPQLLGRRHQLLSQVARGEKDLLALATNVEPELLEEGQEQALAWLIERLDDHERAEIDSIARALERIDRGEYGICEDCRERIPLARLEAVPTTDLCIRCAELREAQVKKP